MWSVGSDSLCRADSTYNVLHFRGSAKIDEGAVKSGIEFLNRLCDETDTTMLALWHPSQSGQQRSDASGWSVAWHNTPRARLSLTPDKGSEGVYELRVEKRNNRPKGKPVTLYWSDGVLLPRTEMQNAEQSSLFTDACIKVALQAAEQDAPIQNQRHLRGWMIDRIEQAAGFKPSERQVKEELPRLLSVGKLRNQKGHGKQMAGYFPVADGGRGSDELKLSGG
jgi:RecA-family ATPase